MRPTRAQILATVLASPAGLTTGELAAHFACPQSQVSATVSKLAAYGAIAAEPVAGSRQKLRWKPHSRPAQPEPQL